MPKHMEIDDRKHIEFLLDCAIIGGSGYGETSSSSTAANACL